ncbi:hypothetical protein TNCV_2851171 [Trichonephila clavipes]|nr:hypothetical protein TNCV_2851171 [Trichonephila clavipes]
MQAELIKLIHENGHFSVGKTEEIVKQEFFIPNLSNVVKEVIVNCVPCILANKKTGKKKGFLNPISKESIPLSTYHVDFIGPLPSTNKSYQHIFTVVDAFTKFTWLYPLKTVSAESALEKLKEQQKTFGNPIRIISDRGSAFTSKLFNDYCDEENIQHLQIATGVPRGNGQVERIHRTLIPVLTKLSLDDSTKWYKYVDRLQRILNSTISRSTKWTPFELLVGIKMRNKEDILIKDLLPEEMAKELLEQREFLRNDAKRTSKPYSLKIERRITEEERKLRYTKKRPTNHCLFNTSRLYRISAPSAAPPVLTSKNEKGADTSKESDTKFLVKEISKFIHRSDLKEDISLYLKLFERQAQRLNIDQENWVSHLLGLLPTEVSHIIAREPDDKANSYEHVKDLLLKRFKLTPEKFRQLFFTHQKAPERTWIDFYHELNTYFHGWIDGLKIDTFNNSPFVKKQEYKFTEKNRRYEAPGKFEYNRKDKKFPASTNYNKHYEAPVTKYESVKRYQDSAQKGYYNKNYEKHSNHNASKHAQTNYSKSQKFKEPPKETCTLIVKEGLRTKEIFFGKVIITALIDSGSAVSLLRENTSRRIMDPTKLSKNKMLLTGIGEAQVTTIGFFEHKFKIDDENYSLTWHVVPTDKLKFEAVIGSDLLGQASISFTKEGVKFNKYENHAQLMQISAENPRRTRPTSC